MENAHDLHGLLRCSRAFLEIQEVRSPNSAVANRDSPHIDVPGQALACCLRAAIFEPPERCNDQRLVRLGPLASKITGGPFDDVIEIATGLSGKNDEATRHVIFPRVG